MDLKKTYIIVAIALLFAGILYFGILPNITGNIFYGADTAQNNQTIYEQLGIGSGYLKASILDSTTNKPVAITYKIYKDKLSKPILTGTSNGEIKDVKLDVGKYTIKAEATNYVSKSLTFSILNDKTTTKSIKLEPQKVNATISVIDDIKEPVAKAKVTLTNKTTGQASNMVTNAKGIANFYNLKVADEYVISITAANYATYTNSKSPIKGSVFQKYPLQVYPIIPLPGLTIVKVKVQDDNPAEDSYGSSKVTAIPSCFNINADNTLSGTIKCDNVTEADNVSVKSDSAGNATLILKYNSKVKQYILDVYSGQNNNPVMLIQWQVLDELYTSGKTVKLTLTVLAGNASLNLTAKDAQGNLTTDYVMIYHYKPLFIYNSSITALIKDFLTNSTISQTGLNLNIDVPSDGKAKQYEFELASDEYSTKTIDAVVGGTYTAELKKT